MTIDWKAWDEQLAATLAYLNTLPEQITVDQADKIFDILPEEYKVVCVDVSHQGVSKTAMIYVLQMLPIVATYDYDIKFGTAFATITLRYRDSLSYTFDFNGFCTVGANDRVGNGFQWGGCSKKFQPSAGWRENFEQSTINKLGKGFTS